MSKKEAGDSMDVGSLFRGTATFTFVAEIVSAIMLLGSTVAFILRDQPWLQDLQPDVVVFLLLLAGMITLFFFLGAIGFFVRFNRRVTGAVISHDITSVDLGKPRVRSVIIIYGIGVGLILVMGVYGYYLIYRYYFAALAATSLSFFGITLSLGIFIVALLVQIVVIALGRTAASMIRTVLNE
ncbi:MAG: hypothetical protein ACFFEU_13520 [Candidatus Thorarchaeota archaeon]